VESKSILLVEDNADDEALMLRALRKSKITSEVVVARNGAEALDYLLSAGDEAARDPAAQPTLILLDLNLPKVHGLDVLRRLRVDDRTKLIPIVILTSSKEHQDLVSGYSLGANSYVCKPIDFTQFVETVRQLGQYWLELNEPVPA
jgi:two-component system response regulator